MNVSPIPAALDGHFTNLTNFLLDGRVIPFLGAGVNQFHRPAGSVWNSDDCDYLPDGSELVEAPGVDLQLSVIRDRGPVAGVRVRGADERFWRPVPRVARPLQS